MENKKLNFNELFGIALSCLIEHDSGSIDDALDDMRIRDREIRQEIKDWYGWEEEKNQYVPDDDYDEDDEGYDPVNPPINLYDYLTENSNGAWISFSFNLDGTRRFCYGTNYFKNPEILKQYEVIGECGSGFSQSQGTHYELEVRKIDEK